MATQKINEQNLPVNVSETTTPLYMDGTNFIAELTTKEDVFCSFMATTQEEKAELFKAMNNPDFRISDCINKIIMAKDVYAETVKCVNRATGEFTYSPRIVILDTEGKAYQCVSIGMMGALKKVFQVFGMPTWENGLPLEIKQIKKGDRSLLTFDVKL